MGKKKILALLEEFQAGYKARNKDAVNSFVERLFVSGDSVFVLGTGSGELFAGVEKFRELISEDWEYWGDLHLNLDQARIGTEGGHGWFAVEGKVSRSFEDSAARTDRYLSFVADKSNDESMSPKTRLALVNWVLSLTFSRRSPAKREYEVPLLMTGSVHNIAGDWKFAHIHFALQPSDYPDERFEESEAFIKKYDEALKFAESYSGNTINLEIKAMLKDFQELSEDCVDKDADFALGGLEDLRRLGRLDFDIGRAFARHDGTQGWLAALGVLRIEKSEETFYLESLARLEALLKAEDPAHEKLFAVHRLAAGTLKEGASGMTFTYPIRLTASITRTSGSWRIRQAHLSYPDFWLLEGKTGVRR